MLEDVLRDWGGTEVSPMEVYTEIFRLGYGELQRYDAEEYNLKANSLGYWKNDGDTAGHYRVMFDDTFEETLKELQEADFAIVNGISYFGRRNTIDRASKMYALIIDMDGVTDTTLNRFLTAASVTDYDIYPMPTFIALSGHGLHLYYIFEDPIPLYPNIKLQLKAFKYALTEKIWNRYTSELESPQFQGINQGFRPIGGKTKIPGVRVRAFRMSTHPVTLSELGKYVPEESRVDESKLWRESRLTLDEAKKLYPEWYQRKVIGGEVLSGHWTCKRDLYEWWKRQIETGAAWHHRYFCIMALAIYAIKSGVEFEEVEQDALNFIPFMNVVMPDDPFTESDVMSALECYDERYVRFPIDDLVKITGIPIKKNKRNGRKQSVHVARITLLRDNDYPDGSWRNKNGRPRKEKDVREWQATHPDGTVTQCARELEISRSTVYAYWKK